MWLLLAAILGYWIGVSVEYMRSMSRLAEVVYAILSSVTIVVLIVVVMVFFL